MTDLADRLAGAIWGHLVGDAVGVPYEFENAAQIRNVEFGARGSHNQPPGTWSDDGALMLALLDSLLSAGFDTEDQGRRALAWWQDGAYTPDGDGRFDWGRTTANAMANLAGGTPAEKAGGRGEHDNGNGSLMRILPVALVGRNLPDARLIEHADRASSVTHGHPKARVCCALYVLVAKRLLQGADPQEAMEEARGVLCGRYMFPEQNPSHLDALRFVEGYTDRGGRGRVWDSLWSAWDAFAGADSYRSTVERAIRYGNDTDTTACIAGALAGIRWGIEGIPEDWLRGMRGREIVEPLVARLIATARTSEDQAGAGTAARPFTFVDDRTVADADGRTYDIDDAIAALPWVDQLCPMMPHQYAALRRSPEWAWFAVDAMVARNPDSYRAYFRGYPSTNRYWDAPDGLRYWRTRFELNRCLPDTVEAPRRVDQGARRADDWDGPPWAPDGIGLYEKEADGMWWPRFEDTCLKPCRACRRPKRQATSAVPTS